MRLRQLPPAAAPLSLLDVVYGVVDGVRTKFALADLERDFASMLGVRHVFFFSSGRAGLVVLLRALHSLNGRQAVVVPAYTCFSVPAAIHRAGLEVVPCDIDPRTLDFDFPALEALIAESRPLCVISTHLFARQSDGLRARALCQTHGAFLVDDAAQALGVYTPQGYLGTLGDAGLFSFGRGKNVTAAGGGAIVTSAPDLAAAIERERQALCSAPRLHRILRTLIEAVALVGLIQPSIYWMPASLPFLHVGETQYSTTFPLETMSGAQAGLLRRWRRRLASANQDRADSAAAIAPPGTPAAPYLRLPVLCESREARDALYERGRRAGLGFALMYPTSIDAIPAVRAGIGGRSFPAAQSVAERLLTVPVHPLVSERDRHAIKALLAEARLTKAAA